MGTGNVVKLTKEQKRQRNTVRRILWDQIRGPPTHGLDKWAVIREDWNCDDDTEKCRNWLGGAYMCKFPPGVGDTILQIEVDIQEEIFPVVWMIQTSADAPYYPGRHAGRLEFPPKFPMEQLFIIWDTPIFSPFVRFCSGVGQVSSPFDLGKWSPFYTVQHVLQTIANFLVYDPLCRTKLPMSHGTLEIPFEYSVLEERINRFAADKDKFFHATQFFSRVYNRVGKEVDNPVMLESQKQASITVIRELVSSFCNKRPPVPDGRQDLDYVTSFNLVKGNNEWILEERIWADALFLACEFQFVVT
jgi:ubiquitin-protein ligase